MKRKLKNLHQVNVARLGSLADLLVSEPYQRYEYRTETKLTDKPASDELWFSMNVLDVVISETIHVYPDEWHWRRGNEIAYFRDDPLQCPASSAMLFFNLDIFRLTHLFVPFRQSPHYFGGTMLSHKIRPSEVGNNIYSFLKYHNSIWN